MNRFDRSIRAQGEAHLRYGDGDYDIVAPGTFVVCAVTGQRILLDELRYWSATLQEAYATPEASLKRYIETGGGKA